MPFKSREELGGEIDSNINKLGRIDKNHKPTAKEIKQKELMSLLRKLKPLMSKSVGVASKIIDSEDSSEAGKLKAAALLIKTYQDLVIEVYDDSKNADGTPLEAQEIDQSKAPVFSMTIVNSPEDLNN